MIISQKIIESRHKGIKGFAVLIDPDKIEDVSDLQGLINIAIENRVDYFFVGGSFISRNNIGAVVRKLKENSDIPVVLFPGNHNHIDPNADAILFLSLISGRNPEYLIGQQVIAAPFLRKTSLEILPTGYMLVNNHTKSSAAYVSNTTPIPNDQIEIACATAMAGEMLGMKFIYMDAGSGSEFPIPPELISNVRKSINVPLIIGGGIRKESDALNALKAGADVIVVGNGIENSQDLLINISLKVSEYNESLKVH
jgi:putative glycerol-1-phosphate prenyltransferase